MPWISRDRLDKLEQYEERGRRADMARIVNEELQPLLKAMRGFSERLTAAEQRLFARDVPSEGA